MNDEPRATELRIEHDVPLAPLTTLELGGNAQHLVRVTSNELLLEALRWAKAEQLPVTLLGGGSNVVVSDAGVSGLVIVMATRGVTLRDQAGQCVVTARAGEPWDALVALTVKKNLAGLECLSGIPGSAGATPIQNVGAYGQEVSDTIANVEVVDRDSLQALTLTPAECGFAYRDSALKRQPQRYVVTAVSFALTPNGPATVRYAELKQALSLQTAAPDLQSVRDIVIALRRQKAMVLSADSVDRRSAGSFFTNPIVSAAQADAVVARALAAQLVQQANEVPRYPQADGRVKLAAGWLIERAGVRKGERTGAVGISTRHALALVHHGGGSSRELIAFAAQVQARVYAMFGVALTPEPVFVGFDALPL